MANTLFKSFKWHPKMCSYANYIGLFATSAIRALYDRFNFSRESSCKKDLKRYLFIVIATLFVLIAVDVIDVLAMLCMLNIL